MKVGSIVECIEVYNPNNFKGLTVPRKNTPYTIREIVNYGGHICILLQEINNPLRYYITMQGAVEPAFIITSFRELQLPDNIEEIINKELQLK